MKTLVIILGLLSLCFCLPVHKKVIDDTKNGQVGRFIINLKEKADLSHAKTIRDSNLKGQYVYDTLMKHSQRTQEPILSILRKHSDVISIQPFFIANVIAVDARRSVVDILSERPDIKAITSNRPFKVDLGKADLESEIEMIKKEANEWNIEYVNAPEVWSRFGMTGEGTFYANADTGIDYSHSALVKNYRGNNGTSFVHDYNWWDGVKRAQLPGAGECGIDSQVPCDDNGHGTHTTGTSVGANGIGVAPGATWIGCRNMDRGYGAPETYLSCLEFFLAPTDLKGGNPNVTIRPHAIGNSYGCTDAEGCVGDEFGEASESLRASGIFMSVSAGNSGPSCSTIVDPPATEPSVITIGALMKDSDAIASYSSRGPVGRLTKPDLVAPGSQVRSCVPGGGYSSFSGTSMASPHVGAAVSLVTSICPHLAYDVDTFQDLMQSTAKRLYTTQGCGGDSSSTMPNNVFGFGLLDIEKVADACYQK